MPSIDQNVDQWNGEYDWPNEGDEWSKAWGGPRAQWFGSLYPRIRHFLPAEAILEIAPGYGRWTQFLLASCTSYVGVDVSPHCVDACRVRFAEHPTARFATNDGSSLPMVADESIDFAYSFDSLVHVEADTLASYLAELSRVLTTDGVGFIHHSNFGAYRRSSWLTASLPLDRLPNAVQQRIKDARLQPNVHWRAPTVSAANFVDMCETAGLRCVGQELINWGGGIHLIDALSVVTRPESRWDRPNEVVKNWMFRLEARAIRRTAAVYDTATR